VRDTTHWQEVCLFPGHSSAVTSCAWSPDSLAFLTSSDDGTIRVWRNWKGIHSREDTATWVQAHGWALSPDGQRTVFIDARDRTLKTVDAGMPIQGLNAMALDDVGRSIAALPPCAFSPDGRRLLVGQGRDVVVCDAEDGSAISLMKGHDSNVTGCAWAPDGKRAASTSSDNTVRIWDIRTGMQVALWVGPPPEGDNVVFGDRGSTYACSWSPDGSRLAFACDRELLYGPNRIPYHIIKVFGRDERQGSVKHVATK
jgi:WD40 repeat protein